MLALGEKHMARSKTSQTKHDAAVRRIANEFKKKGYDVKADVSGFRKPDTIRGHRPDVVAKKGRERKIVEVETPDSVGTARERGQQQAFRQSAKSSDKTTFERRVTKKT